MPSTIRWEPITGRRNQFAADGPWGRYLVRREAPRVRRFIVLLNGRSTKLRGDSADTAIEAAEQIIKTLYPTYRSMPRHSLHTKLAPGIAPVKPGTYDATVESVIRRGNVLEMTFGSILKRD